MRISYARNIYQTIRHANFMLNYLAIDTAYHPVYDVLEIDDNIVLNAIGDRRYIRNEVYNMIEKYINSNEYSPYPYSYKVISLAIIAEVLEHYNISYDLVSLLKAYDISLNAFDNMSYRIREWARKNYWRDSITYFQDV